MAWRGIVSENIASHETKKVSGNLLSIYQRPGTQIFTHAYPYPLPSVRKQQPIVRQVHDPSQRRCPTTRTTPSKLGLVQRLTTQPHPNPPSSRRDHKGPEPGYAP